MKERERARYQFDDSESFSIPSAIRTVDYRQESESPSSPSRLQPAASLSPFLLPLVAIMLVPRQLTVDRFYRFPSFATAWLALLVFFYASSSDLLLSGFLSPSPSPSRPASPSTLRASRVTSRAHCPDLPGDRNIPQPPPSQPTLSSPSPPRGTPAMTSTRKGTVRSNVNAGTRFQTRTIPALTGSRA